MVTQTKLDYDKKWRKTHPDNVKRWCKKYYQKNKKKCYEMTKRWRAKNKKQFNAYQKKWRDSHMKNYRANIRKIVINHYGGKCKCCGEKQIEFLAIDHIRGNGKQERLLRGNRNITEWLRQNNYPKGYRILCHNCNLSLGFYGYCPHKRRERI